MNMKPKSYRDLAKLLSQTKRDTAPRANNIPAPSVRQGLMTYGEYLKNKTPAPSVNDGLVREINRTSGDYQKFIQDRMNNALLSNGDSELNPRRLNNTIPPNDVESGASGAGAEQKETEPVTDKKSYEEVDVTGNDTAAVPSYSEVLQRHLNAATDRYNNTVNVAERNRDQTIENAEAERQRAIRDAGSSYQTEKSSYGANAEALRRMGLSGSGYAEYLDSKAYAQKRSDIQGANVLLETRKDAAGNTYADAIAAAKDKLVTEQDTARDTYQENMKAYEEEQEAKAKEANSMYVQILGMVKNGSINEEEALRLAADYGLSTEQTETLSAAAKTVKEDEEKAFREESDANRQGYKTAIDALGKAYDIAEIDRALKNGSLTESDAEWLKNYYYKTYPKTEGEKTTDSISDIQGRYDAGQIDEKQYNEEMKAYTSAACEGGWCITGLGTGIPGDHVGVVVGATADKGVGNKFELVCERALSSKSDKNLISTLNTLATGNPNQYPSKNNENIFGARNTTSDSKPGKLVVYQGKMYLYTTYGWSPLASSGDKVEDAIAAFLKTSAQSENSANSGGGASIASQTKRDVLL